MRNSISEKKYFFSLFFFSFLFLTFSVEPVWAVKVSNIEIIPSALVYNDQFECVFTVDFDESNLACGLLGINDPDTKKPWDICPKTGNLGHRYTEGNKRHYNCVAGSQTGIPAPGRYRIVAWRFYSDGAYGDVVASKEVTILSQAPPTNTPVPAQRPSPSPTQTIVPTVTSPIAPQPSLGERPAIVFSPTQGVQPTISFSQVQNRIPSISGKPSFVFPSLPFNSIISYTQTIAGKTVSLGNATFFAGRDFFFQVLTNFFSETSF